METDAMAFRDYTLSAFSPARPQATQNAHQSKLGRPARPKSPINVPNYSKRQLDSPMRSNNSARPFDIYVGTASDHSCTSANCYCAQCRHSSVARQMENWLLLQNAAQLAAHAAQMRQEPLLLLHLENAATAEQSRLYVAPGCSLEPEGTSNLHKPLSPGAPAPPLSRTGWVLQLSQLDLQAPDSRSLADLRTILESRSSIKLLYDCRGVVRVLCQRYGVHLLRRKAVDLQAMERVYRNDLFDASSEGRSMAELMSYYGVAVRFKPDAGENQSSVCPAAVNEQLGCMEMLFKKFRSADPSLQRNFSDTNQKIDNELVRIACRHPLSRA